MDGPTVVVKAIVSFCLSIDAKEVDNGIMDVGCSISTLNTRRERNINGTGRMSGRGTFATLTFIDVVVGVDVVEDVAVSVVVVDVGTDVDVGMDVDVGTDVDSAVANTNFRLILTTLTPCLKPVALTGKSLGVGRSHD